MKEHLIISPHLDDAMLSLGGFMLRNPGCRVLDLCNTAWSELKHLKGQTVEVITAQNLREEEQIMREAGATFHFENLPEALARDPKMEWNDPIDLKRDYKTQLSMEFALAREAADAKNIYFPMAVGEHTDHMLAFGLAETFMKASLKPGQTLYLYEDLPYSTYNDNDNNYDRRLGRVRNNLIVVPSLINITSQVDEKIRILHYYESQLNADHLKRVRDYAFAVGEQGGSSGEAFERVWEIKSVCEYNR